MTVHCDFCRTQLPNISAAPGAAITYLPCFHSMCFRCKLARLKANPERIICAICNLQCFSSELFDFLEVDPTKIFCFNCNINARNRPLVQWCCNSCGGRYLCGDCAQPHVQTGHSLQPIKPEIPVRSQCSSHPGAMATHFCSCQAQKMCQECAEKHKLVAPTHQFNSYLEIAEAGRNRLITLRNKSHNDIGIIDKLLPIISKNKATVRDLCAKARTSVADEVVELCNCIMRRGNDIIAHIDMIEDARQKHYAMCENELKIQYDRLKKVESFTENSMVIMTQSQDLPGISSASQFAQSAYKNICEKRTPEVQNSIEMAQRPPNIRYISDLAPVVNSIRSHGQIDLDGVIKTPAFVTPQNARMFTVMNQPLPQHMLNSGRIQPQVSTPPQNLPLSPFHYPQLNQQITAQNVRAGVSHTITAQIPGMTTNQQQIQSPIDLHNRNLLQNQHFQQHQKQQPQNKNQQAEGSSSSALSNLTSPPPPQPNFIINSAQQQPLKDGFHQNLNDKGTPMQLHNIEQQQKQQQKQHLYPNITDHLQHSPEKTMSRPKAQSAAADSTVPSNGTSSPNSFPIGNNSSNNNSKDDSGTVGDQPPSPKKPKQTSESCAVLENDGNLKGASPSITTTMMIEDETMTTLTNNKTKEKDEGNAEITSDRIITSSEKANEIRKSKSSEEDSANDESNTILDKSLAEWDDYCFVCGNGCDEKSGELGCCDKCPRVFHNKCHVPRIKIPMEETPDDWTCTLCIPTKPIETQTSSFGEQEKMLCAKVLLSCFTDNSLTEPFLTEVSKSEAAYHAIIKNPISLNTISKRISSNFYENVDKFMEDMNLLFSNCSTFNPPDTSVSRAGMRIWEEYKSAIKRYLPAYENKVWIYISLYIHPDKSKKRHRIGKSVTPS